MIRKANFRSQKANASDRIALLMIPGTTTRLKIGTLSRSLSA